MKSVLCLMGICVVAMLSACAVPATTQPISPSTLTPCVTRAATSLVQTPAASSATTQAGGRTNPVTPESVPPTVSPELQATMDARILQSGGAAPTFPALTPVGGLSSPCATPTP